MTHWQELFQQIVDNPVPSATIILNLILIESILSVDNAAVLATMVIDLPEKQRVKALRYGILGAYVFRGLSLIFAAYLIEIWWFKPVGGIYLLFLAIKHFISRIKHVPDDAESVEVKDKSRSWLYKVTLGALGPLWATVVLVEIMDLAFSIDNVIAANAYTDNIILICVGVFIGILAMRFVAQGFVKLMERYPFLDICAYSVIALLGLKLTISVYTHFNPCAALSKFIEGLQACMEHHGEVIPMGEHPMVWGDIITSVLSVSIFLLPVLYSMIFNPRKKGPQE